MKEKKSFSDKIRTPIGAALLLICIGSSQSSYAADREIPLTGKENVGDVIGHILMQRAPVTKFESQGQKYFVVNPSEISTAPDSMSQQRGTGIYLKVKEGTKAYLHEWDNDAFLESCTTDANGKCSLPLPDKVNDFYFSFNKLSSKTVRESVPVEVFIHDKISSPSLYENLTFNPGNYCPFITTENTDYYNTSGTECLLTYGGAQMDNGMYSPVETIKFIYTPNNTTK